ncbi:MAG: DUF5668 domain-containing protein [Candidatus Saccharibacteria bacterium]
MENNKANSTFSKNGNWGIGRIFWGLLLVLVGVMLIAENFGYINVNWVDLLRLWPLLVIAAGLSILSVKSVVWKIFTIILAVVTLSAIAFVALSAYPSSRPINREIQIDQNGVHMFLKY